MANLVNAGILPLTFKNEEDYDKIDQMDDMIIENAAEQIKSGTVTVKNTTKGFDFETVVSLSDRQKEMIYAGGLLNYTRQSN